MKVLLCSSSSVTIACLHKQRSARDNKSQNLTTQLSCKALEGIPPFFLYDLTK